MAEPVREPIQRELRLQS